MAQMEQQSAAVRYIDRDAFDRLMRAFAIGTPVRCHQPGQRDPLFESRVAAYTFNDQPVYEITRFFRDEQTDVITFVDRGRRQTFGRIQSLCIVVPPTGFKGDEKQLADGTALILYGEPSLGKVPLINVVVDSRARLTGPEWGDLDVVLLRAEWGSLALADQRVDLRMATNVPVSLQVGGIGRDTTAIPCRLVDFSERSIRLVAPADTEQKDLPRASEAVMVSFQSHGRSQQVTLLGDVYRLEDHNIVIQLTGMISGGRQSRLDPMELLQIKADLLRYAK